MTIVISIVIPVYNEMESLLPLHAEIVAVAQREALDLEIVFVDDGSTDGSWKIVKQLSLQHANVHGVRFRRNFGKAAALSAGFRAAKGELVMTLDADLQDDPVEIPRFLRTMAQGTGPSQAEPQPVEEGRTGVYDVVSGWKRVRHDPWHKVGPSRIFNLMVSWLTGVWLHDHNCGMKCYRAEVFKEIRLYGELHRFIPVLAAARGYRVGEIEINHRARKFGSSKYGFRRFVKGFLDLLTVKFLTGFGQRPQHILGTLGIISFVVGNLAMVYLAITWIINFFYPGTFKAIHERAAPIFALAALVIGAQFMTIGFLAELITAYTGRDEDTYSVMERTTSPPHQP